MVISGGNLKPDTLKPKEVVSLLLDDDEIESKCKNKKITFIYISNKYLKLLQIVKNKKRGDNQKKQEPKDSKKKIGNEKQMLVKLKVLQK